MVNLNEIEDIVRDALREHSYFASEDCVVTIAARIDEYIDYREFVEGGA